MSARPPRVVVVSSGPLVPRREAILTPRLDPDVANLRDGEYHRGPGGVVMIGCPCCGHVSELANEVAANGTVVGLWVCPAAWCPAMLWMELDG